MKAVTFAFKKGKADTYKSNEGIIFTVNGQTHGHLPTSFFRRQNVGMSYLRDSILVAVDCSEIGARARDELFMNSRNRLAHCDLRNELEKELERILRTHSGLCDLRERRRREEVEARVAEDKPLEEVLRNLLNTNPSLALLLRDGRRMESARQKISLGSRSTFGSIVPLFSVYTCHIRSISRTILSTT